jgi:hypothetical protein
MKDKLEMQRWAQMIVTRKAIHLEISNMCSMPGCWNNPKHIYCGEYAYWLCSDCYEIVMFEHKANREKNEK